MGKGAQTGLHLESPRSRLMLGVGREAQRGRLPSPGLPSAVRNQACTQFLGTPVLCPAHCPSRTWWKLPPLLKMGSHQSPWQASRECLFNKPMNLDSTKHPVSQRECLAVPLPPTPARRGRGWTRHKSASLCQAWTQSPPTPRRGPHGGRWCWVMRATYLTGLPSGRPFCGLKGLGRSHGGWPRCVRQPTVAPASVGGRKQ